MPGLCSHGTRAIIAVPTASKIGPLYQWPRFQDWPLVPIAPAPPPESPPPFHAGVFVEHERVPPRRRFSPEPATPSPRAMRRTQLDINADNEAAGLVANMAEEEGEEEGEEEEDEKEEDGEEEGEGEKEQKRESQAKEGNVKTADAADNEPMAQQ
ncbi:hypothetical protein KC315_g12308 [Hortaea werneckii]|nr:hypothetical protein KC315_g12308 [Hortaea werneckii]